MKITDVELYSNNMSFIDFSVRKAAPSAKFMIRDILGLGPDEVIPTFYGFGLESKSNFMDFAMKPRDIVMKIALNPRFNLGEDYADVRDELYKAISSSRIGLIDIHFKSEGVNIAKISGYITKVETVHFAQKPEVQLTIQCNDPFFTSIEMLAYDLTNLNPGSSPPLTNPIIISDGLSTAPHGFILQATFTDSSPTLIIQDSLDNYEWQFAIYPVNGFLASDQVYLSSDRLNKQAYMVRGGITTHLMDKIDTTSLWPILFPGSNSFYIPEINKLTITNVEFYANYWGV